MIVTGYFDLFKLCPESLENLVNAFLYVLVLGFLLVLGDLPDHDTRYLQVAVYIGLLLQKDLFISLSNVSNAALLFL